MRIQLSDHFNYTRLIRFVMPSILMIVCTSVYSIVDGLFVSNFVGKTPFAAINLTFPVLMGVSTIGCMIGTGGAAVIAKTLGEGKKELANQYFSMLIYISFVATIFLSVAGFIFMPQMAAVLGAEGELLENCIIYGRISFISAPALILQQAFNSFFIAGEKPELALKVSIFAGLTNVILDYILIVLLEMGLAGAAVATALGEVVGGVFPIIYFARKNDSLLRLTLKTKVYWRVFAKACANGSSEMVSMLSASAVNILYNFQLMRFAGEDGVAAYGVIMYVNMIFMAVYLGYSMGSAPIVSFHYGAGNHSELKNMFRKSLILVGCGGILITICSELLARPLSLIFVSYDNALLEMTVHGFRIYALSFLIRGISVWGSSFFTALNNGAVSAAISFLRTLVFQVIAVIALPLLWGLDGVWLSALIVEILALLVTVAFLIGKRTKYNYM